ncbi:hypothetical protein Q6A88_08860 [Aliarcobacter skirrowii]|uniref:hypothetical protein n=1 Tax=Aliarcobacter skirrowii TaxID=28200 RepID=UPI0029BB6095|nr:hypothetical protein [Aliarcobacter skirrowii]MDX4071806.1 hypothetical protein [Aliarcobacter skirrowii]
MIKNMKIKKNIFIVGTPLQVINAIEAIHHFKLRNIVFVIKHNKIQKNRIHLESIIKSLNNNFEIIHMYPSVKNTRIVNYIKTIKYLKKNLYQYFFIGDFSTFTRIAIANLNKEKLFLLDDGIGTIIHLERDIKPNKINKYRFREYRFLFYGFKIKVCDKINLFTYFNIKFLNGVEVIKNNLTYMKSKLESRDNDEYKNVLFFIGQDWLMHSHKEDLWNDLVKLSQTFKDKKIVYIPHREETEYDLKNVKLIKNIDILELNQSVEQYFIDNLIYPLNLISFISTALVTTKILFPKCNVNYIKIKNPNYKVNSGLTYLDSIYKVLESNDISELEL